MEEELDENYKGNEIGLFEENSSVFSRRCRQLERSKPFCYYCIIRYYIDILYIVILRVGISWFVKEIRSILCFP